MSRGVSNEMDLFPFAQIARSGLPPRVRGLLEGSYHAAAPIIDSALSRALDELDRDLMSHAERGANITEQNQCFASLRQFRHRRADFLQACRAAVQRSMLALIDPAVSDETLKMVTARDGVSDPGAADVGSREEDMTLSQIATRAEIRAGAALQALSYRFGLIAGSPPIDIEELVLGPYKLCAAIRTAARRFEVFPAHRLALYRRIDKTLFAEPGGLYDAVNGYLADHRVFAHLQLAPPTDAIEEIVIASVATPAPAPEPAAAPAVAPTAAPAAQKAAVATPATRAFQQLLETAAPGRPRAAPLAAQESPLDAQFFRTLREHVSAVRNSSPAADAAADQGRPLADRRELIAALSVLQAQPPAPIMVGGKWANRNVAHIKQDLMNQLRSLSDGGPPRVRDEDADSIDLIGLLFEQLLGAYRGNSISHGLVSRLQIPLLKVALKDWNFYTRRTHSARRFVNAMVECLADWVEDEDSDRHVIEKLQMVVDRLTREFDDDISIFDRCLDDLGKHVGSLQKKAEVAERRHVEAAKGREKLDLARAAAQEAVQHRLAGSPAPGAVKALLESAWTDAIALALLRQGVDHPKTSERMLLVDHLVAVFRAGRAMDEQHQALEQLRPVLEEGLAAVGFHDDAISSAWGDLCSLVDVRHEQAQQAAAEAISELIRQKPRFGGEATSGSAAGEHGQLPVNVDMQALDATERAMVEHIRQLPFGTWFEFTVGRNQTSRRRLSWFSPVTGRCVFVNLRGAKCEERSIPQLAREILTGVAREGSEDRDDPTERAWRAIQASTRDARPEPVRTIKPTN